MMMNHPYHRPVLNLLWSEPAPKGAGDDLGIFPMSRNEMHHQLRLSTYVQSTVFCVWIEIILTLESLSTSDLLTDKEYSGRSFDGIIIPYLSPGDPVLQLMTTTTPEELRWHDISQEAIKDNQSKQLF